MCIALCLVDIALGVLLSGKYIVERFDHLLRRVGLVDFDTLHGDPCTITVEHGLHPRHNGQFDVSTAFTRKHAIEWLFGHRGTHGRFGCFKDGLFGFLQLELIISQVLDIPANQITQINQVLIPCQDQLFLVALWNLG